MSISSINSGYQIMQGAQDMSNQAAMDINSAARMQNQRTTQSDLPAKDTVQKNTNTSNARYQRPDQIDALTKLNQAETYGRTGSHIIHRSNDMVGSILDMKA